jgi:transcriptional regulator with XRE-family HTH domain
MSRVERAVTYVGLEIIGKLANVLGVDPAEFFRGPARSGSRKKAE